MVRITHPTRAGGLGVFEGFMLLTFRHLIPAESLSTALLLYRAIYYLAPLMLAALILAGREVTDRVLPLRRSQRLFYLEYYSGSHTDHIQNPTCLKKPLASL